MGRFNKLRGKSSLDLIAFGLLAAMLFVMAFPLAQGLREGFASPRAELTENN